jgi:putative endonuclease
MSEDPKPLGTRGEEVACETLKRSGYRILQQNYHCPLGEIDLVARQGRTLVFVEVKSRLGRTRILPKERVDRKKQRKLLQVAQFYIKEKRLEAVSARFDVVEVSFRDGALPEVDVIPNAFEAQDRW